MTPNYTIVQNTPIGQIYVIITENDRNTPETLQVFGGKAGTEFFAYCHSISGLGTELFKYPNGLSRILEILSGITTSKSVTDNKTGIKCRSGAEGIYLALLKYQNIKYQEALKEERNYPARFFG